MSLVWVAFGLAGPGPRQRAPSREGSGKGKATGTPGAREPERKPKGVQQTGFSYI